MSGGFNRVAGRSKAVQYKAPTKTERQLNIEDEIRAYGHLFGDVASLPQSDYTATINKVTLVQYDYEEVEATIANERHAFDYVVLMQHHWERLMPVDTSRQCLMTLEIDDIRASGTALTFKTELLRELKDNLHVARELMPNGSLGDVVTFLFNVARASFTIEHDFYSVR